MSKRWLFVLALLCKTVVTSVYAQDFGILPGETLTQPKERPVTVTASVRDNTAPSTPILISPENSSLIKTNTPTFIWKESTDESSIHHYTLTLDGSVLFDTIPTTTSENDDYILTYDGTTTYFSLIPKKSLTDGQHTWKITAHDYYTNTASSVTWTFTIDTQAPIFVITKIDQEVTSISAQDTSTVPTEPIVLKNNEPILSGTGEAKSTVVLTVNLPNGTTQTTTFSIDDQGTWSVQLATLPRDVIIYLDFLITDLAGHISVLTDVPITLPTPKVVIPIPIVPPEVIPPIEIPIVPIPELIPPIIEVITEPLPPSVQQLTAAFPFYYPTPKSPGYNYFINFLVLIVISTLPLLKTILLSRDFGSSFSFNSLLEIWRAIGLIGYQSPQGIVVEKHTQSPISYAKVVFTGKIDTYTTKQFVKLTSTNGTYSHANLPEGNYRISIEHPHYLFPVTTTKPEHLDWQTYYQGQEFEVKAKGNEPPCIVPVAINHQQTMSLLSEVKYWVLTRTMATFKMSTLCVIISMLFPSYFNVIATIFYWFVLAILRVVNKETKVYGAVLSKEKEPIKNAILFLLRKDLTTVESITQSNSTGDFYLQGSAEAQYVRFCDFIYQIEGLTDPDKLLTVERAKKQDKIYLPIITVSRLPSCPLPAIR